MDKLPGFAGVGGTPVRTNNEYLGVRDRFADRFRSLVDEGWIEDCVVG